MKTLNELMTERLWEQDWPVIETGIALSMPTGWPGLSHSEDQAEVKNLLAKERAHPTVLGLRTALEDIDKWNDWANQYLTYPATVIGMGKALAEGLKPGTGRNINDLTHRVIGLYPQMSWAVFNAVPNLVKELPAEWREKGWPTPVVKPASVAAGVVPAPAEVVLPENAPAPMSAPAYSGATPVHPPASASRAAEKTEASPAQRTEAAQKRAARWIREQLLPIARRTDAAPLIIQDMDEAIKLHLNATLRPDWAEEILLPSLMALNGDELGELMIHWPPSARYALTNPLETVAKPRFWAQLREADDGARQKLVSDVLPRVIRSEDWSSEDRLRMLRQMLGFVKSDRANFEQRIELWEKWGGNLHEKGVLAKDRAAQSEEDSAFGTSPAAKSGMDWIAEQPHEMWKAWLADRQAAEKQAPSTRRALRPH
jgi:hypothetical protein